MLMYETKTNPKCIPKKEKEKGNIKSAHVVRKLSFPPQDPTFPVHNSLKAIKEETNLKNKIRSLDLKDVARMTDDHTGLDWPPRLDGEKNLK